MNKIFLPFSRPAGQAAERQKSNVPLRGKVLIKSIQLILSENILPLFQNDYELIGIAIINEKKLDIIGPGWYKSDAL